jgi:NAD(P)H-flavin reductase
MADDVRSADSRAVSPSAEGGRIDPMVPRWYRVLRSRRETHDTFTLEIEPVDGVVHRFRPGQFDMLYHFGVGEVPISFSGDPSSPTLVHTLRGVGAVTDALLRLKAGAVVGVRGPFGNAWPVEEAAGHDVLLIGGGIGLAPLRPALYALLAQRGRYGRIAVLYGARKPEDLLFRRELARWRGRFDLEVEVTVDSAGDGWHGQVGVVTSLLPRVSFDPMLTTAMICGPEMMMRFTVRALEQRGVAPARIFVSMERNMKCAVGLCGHCQYGPTLICRDGPVYPFDLVADLFAIREV